MCVYSDNVNVRADVETIIVLERVSIASACVGIDAVTYCLLK